MGEKCQDIGYLKAHFYAKTWVTLLANFMYTASNKNLKGGN